MPLLDGPDLDINTRTYNTLRHVTASPGKVGDIVRAALVLTHFKHGYIT